MIPPKSPAISVLIRTFNSEQYIKESLESVFFQTIDSSLYEILVFDNGSKDKTCNILQKYVKEGKIRLFENNQVGPVALLNLALQEARGKYYIIVDSDDLLADSALEILYNALLSSDDTTQFSYADYYEFEDGKEDDAKIVYINNNVYNTLAAGILFPITPILKIGGYDETLFFPEYDLLYRLCEHNAQGIYVAEPLYYYRRHEQSLTSVKERVVQGKAQLFKKLGVTLPIREY